MNKFLTLIATTACLTVVACQSTSPNSNTNPSANPSSSASPSNDTGTGGNLEPISAETITKAQFVKFLQCYAAKDSSQRDYMNLLINRVNGMSDTEWANFGGGTVYSNFVRQPGAQGCK